MAEVKTAVDSSDKTFDCLNAKSSKKTSRDELAPGFTIPTEEIAGVPDFGWRVPLSYSCPMKCKAFFTPRLKQIPSYIGLGVR